MSLIFKLTAAGEAALVNAAQNGTAPRLVKEVGVSATAIVPGAPIVDEIKRIDTIAGGVVAPNVIHITVRDETAVHYTVRSFGLYLDNGVLLGTFGQADVIVEKSPQAAMLMALDIVVEDGATDISTLEFGDTDFMLPPATEQTAGVMALASQAEVNNGVTSNKAVTPATLKARIDSRQPISTVLTAIAALAPAANRIPMFSAADVAQMLTFSTSAGLGTSDSVIPSQKAVKTYVDQIIAAQDAMVFKGLIDCSGNPNYPAADCGWTFRVNVAGKIGGVAGVPVQAGDLLICGVDGAAAGTQATVGAAWGVIQTNIDGALTTADIGSSVQAYATNLAALAALSAVNLGPITPISRANLPTTNIGPIIVAGGDGVWEWSTSAYYTGYRHPRCGEPIFGVTAAPRSHEIAAVGGLFNKADYLQLWGFAQESGLVVSQAQFDAELGALWYVNVSATQFRAPNLLGPNGWGMFPRWAAGGSDADTANAVALGARKLDTLQGHRHRHNLEDTSVWTELDISHAPGAGASIGARALQILDPISDGVHGTPRVGMETASRFAAFHPRIHV